MLIALLRHGAICRLSTFLSPVPGSAAKKVTILKAAYVVGERKLRLSSGVLLRKSHVIVPIPAAETADGSRPTNDAPRHTLRKMTVNHQLRLLSPC